MSLEGNGPAPTGPAASTAGSSDVSGQVVAEGQQIRAASILPARREDIEFTTEDGNTLVGELALPEGGAPRATLLTLHPLPTHGGYMDSHVYRKAAWRLPALAGVAVLRFNLRGVSSARGTSEGEFDAGRAEHFDVSAVHTFATERGLPNLWWVGWSFGTDLTLRYGLLPGIEGAVLLSPPLRYAQEHHLKAWGESGLSVTALVPEHDEFLPPAAAQVQFAPLAGVNVVPVEGAKHLWVGEKYVRHAHHGILTGVGLGDCVPLPTHWAGPMETARDIQTSNGFVR